MLIRIKKHAYKRSLLTANSLRQIKKGEQKILSTIHSHREQYDAVL